MRAYNNPFSTQDGPTPTRRQRSILQALSRPGAYIAVATNGPTGFVVTNGTWIDDRASRAITHDEINALGRNGWIVGRKAPYAARTTFVLTLAGREAAQC